MTLPPEPPWDLIAAYTAGEPLTAQQQQRLRHWQQTDPSATAILKQARRVYAAKAPPVDPLAAWNRIHQRIQTNLTHEKPSPDQ